MTIEHSAPGMCLVEAESPRLSPVGGAGDMTRHLFSMEGERLLLGRDRRSSPRPRRTSTWLTRGRGLGSAGSRGARRTPPWWFPRTRTSPGERVRGALPGRTPSQGALLEDVQESSGRVRAVALFGPLVPGGFTGSKGRSARTGEGPDGLVNERTNWRYTSMRRSPRRVPTSEVGVPLKTHCISATNRTLRAR